MALGSLLLWRNQIHPSLCPVKDPNHVQQKIMEQLLQFKHTNTINKNSKYIVWANELVNIMRDEPNGQFCLGSNSDSRHGAGIDTENEESTISVSTQRNGLLIEPRKHIYLTTTAWAFYWKWYLFWTQISIKIQLISYYWPIGLATKQKLIFFFSFPATKNKNENEISGKSRAHWNFRSLWRITKPNQRQRWPESDVGSG